MNRKTGFWIALWLVLVLVTGYFAFFHAPFGRMGYGPWHGWDGGRGWGGMGPGWMGRTWPDGEWGRARPYGMMGPYGRGFHGMGLGMQPGAYSVAPWWLYDLSEEQTRQLGKLQDEWLDRNLGIMRQTWEARARLETLYAADKRDWNAIRAASRELSDLQRQQMDAAIEFQQKIDALLSDAQRK